VKAFFEKHKTAILIIGGIIGLYLFYKWYQGYSANQSAASDAAAQAAEQAALQNQYLASTGTTDGGASANGSASTPGLISVGLPSTTPTGSGATNPTSTNTTPVLNTPYGPVPTNPTAAAQQANQPLIGNVIPNAPAAQSNPSIHGPGATAAQAAILKNAVATGGNLSPSDAVGSYNYTLNQVGAESEPGFNQAEFDQYWSSLTTGGPGGGFQASDNVAIPAFVAFAGSDPQVVNTEYEAMGLPPPFPGLGTGASPAPASEGSSSTATSTTPAKSAAPVSVGVGATRNPYQGAPLQITNPSLSQQVIGGAGQSLANPIPTTNRTITTTPTNTPQQPLRTPTANPATPATGSNVAPVIRTPAPRPVAPAPGSNIAPVRRSIFQTLLG